MPAETVRRGEIWVATLNPNRGAEVGKTRPVLILQEDRLTQAGLPTIVVAPLTSQLRPALAPLRFCIEPRNRMLKPSYVMVEHLRAIDRSRLGEGPLMSLRDEEMAAIEKRLMAVMGIL